MLRPIDYGKYANILLIKRQEFRRYQNLLTLFLQKLATIKNAKQRLKIGVMFYDYTIKRAMEFYNIYDTTEQIYNNKKLLILQILNSNWSNLTHTYMSTFTSILQYEKRQDY
jgi:hypothetical protein